MSFSISSSASPVTSDILQVRAFFNNPAAPNSGIIRALIYIKVKELTMT